MEPDRAKLLLSAQRALLGAIGPAVLAVAVKAEGDAIGLYAVVDDDMTEEERESLEVAGTEILADFPGMGLQGVHFVRRPRRPIEGRGTWVFVRRGFDVA